MPYRIVKEESYSNFQGINNKASRKITGKNQVLDLSNLDLQAVGALSKRPGTTMLVGATLSGRIGAFYEYNKIDGTSYLITSANTSVYVRSGGAWNPIRTLQTDSGIYDFVTFVDYLFATNGSDFWKFNGTAATAFALPPGATVQAQEFAAGGSLAVGYYKYAYGFLNDRGYYGPATNETGITVTLDSVVYGWGSGFSAPQGYGISAFIIYRSAVGGAGDLAQIAEVDTSLTFYSDLGATLTSRLANDNIYFWPGQTLGLVNVTGFQSAPKSIELWNNQLFLLNFDFPSAQESRFYYSDIGDPESIPPENYEEVRTNDGDYLTAAKAFGAQLVICKTRSIHALTGNDPDNFELREISDQYGCLSRRAITVWDQKCWFLDQKGICEFNGSDTKIVSTAVEETFAAMNIPVAKQLAQMLHVKQRNEIWCNIPINGASHLNTTVVYDYDVGGWWLIEGVNMSAMGIYSDDVGSPAVGFGDFSGAVSTFNSTCMSDNQRGMTCRVRFPFKAVEESATEHMFRRLWIDTDPQYGGTKVITVNFYKDQGNVPVLSRTVYQNEFQTRTEFGIPAKDLSIELIFSEASPLRINGYTLGHRFQRDV